MPLQNNPTKTSRGPGGPIKKQQLSFFFQYKLPNVHTIYFNPTHESIQANNKIYIVGPRTETPLFFFVAKIKSIKRI